MPSGIAAEYVMEPGRYFICRVVEQPHPTHAGKAGLILDERDTLVDAERALVSITSKSMCASGGGHVKALGDCVVGIFDRVRQEWL